MGWHTLKRKDRSLKKVSKSNSVEIKDETDNGNINIDILRQISLDELVIQPDGQENVQTLLAKALFDNLADAPDELTFRKGDIVTVIERDVDGLDGWWLCLLHGRQGIVPGNRLKVIPPVELDQFEKQSKRRVSCEADEHSDVGGDGGGNYDRLPLTKRTPNDPPPLTIKDMFHIPYKNESKIVSEEVYDIPKTNLNDFPQEIYDVPKQNEIAGEEFYDVPKNKFIHEEKNEIAQEEFYDVPKNKFVHTEKNEIAQEEFYDVPKNRIIQEELYDIPKGNVVTPTENYKVPTNKSTSSFEKFDNNKNPSKKNIVFEETYDIPIMKKATQRNQYVIEETYNVPNALNQTNKLLQQTQNNSNISDNILDVDQLMGEIYDSPFNTENQNTIKRSPKSSENNTPRNSRHEQEAEELYDTPKNLQEQDITQEIYDVPKHLMDQLDDLTINKNDNKNIENDNNNLNNKKDNENNNNNNFNNRNNDKNNNECTPSQRNNNFEDLFYTPTGSSEQITEEIYDVPKGATRDFISPEIYSTPKGSMEKLSNDVYLTPRGSFNNLKTNTQTALQEIYDIPPTHQDLLNTPSSNKNHSFLQTAKEIPQEIYDVPSSNKNLSNKQTTNYSNYQQEELYDVPPSSRQQEIYDVPVHHDVAQVMADVKFSNQSKVGHRLQLAEVDDDDYVDYHDIWNNEPPTDLMNHQSISSYGSLLHSPSDIPKSPNSESKKSILDQINFEAVKELHITVSEANQRLTKLHLAVDTVVQALTSFCKPNWLDVSMLIPTINFMRDYAAKLKTALRLLTEFGLGVLVNTTKSPNGEMLMDKIIGNVEPLLECYYKIKICLMHLDSQNWCVPQERSSTNDKFFATLNAVMILSQRIPDQCQEFSKSVQNNANELFDPDPVPVRKPSPYRPPPLMLPTEPEMSADALRQEMIGRRKQARDASTLPRPIPMIPPKPSLPNQRRSLAVSLEPPESPRYNLNSRGFNHIERLVTDYVPEDSRQKKYASDPATPSHTGEEHISWGGSCPVLLNRNSAFPTTPLRGAESSSSSSSVSASITEETIEVRQTNFQDNSTRIYPADSNISSTGLTSSHIRSASLPKDIKKNKFHFDDGMHKSSPISPLDHRDIEALEFFCRQVESQVMLLRDSMKNLQDAVELRQEPHIFVSHSKFIILTAHKVVHGGQDILERLLNNDVKLRLKNSVNHLNICIRGVVASTKTAALEYPEPNALLEMISSILALGDAVRIIHSECRRALDA